MKRRVFTLIIIVLSVFIISLPAYAAITININSGNPKMPFPQFLDYTGGATLASHWPDGVSHAEMEQWLRDAWKIHSNEFSYNGTITYGGKTVNLIKDTSSPYCSEGHGYALLGAALMCDKDAFDGLWFYLNENHYFNRSTVYSTGVVYNPGYNFGIYAPAWAGAGSDAATDGDDDIALACLIAWKQWGDGSGYYAPGGTGPAGAGGNEIQYKQMAIDMMRYMVAKAEGDNVGDAFYDSGDIGFDGYIKSGNTWGEVTNWAISQPGDKPNRAGPQQTYFDYIATGYFRCFGETLQANGDPAWNYTQYQRATASSTWVMGQLAASANKTIEAGYYSINGTTCTFANFNPGGEDFRAPLRSGLDYLWNGNPTDSWNPTTHQVVAGGNTWMYNAMIKQANFLNNPQAQGVACVSYGSSPVTYQGVAALTEYNLDGSSYWTFHLNRFGASAPAAVASQNFDFMGQMFRELMIEWDSAGGTNSYLGSIPAYFHGFFRQVGLMVLTGNWPDPCSIAATANMKIYKAIDKTYAFPGDLITFWLNYRNYGSVDAAGVVIRDTIPSAFSYYSATPAGVAVGGNAYEWTIGSVTGFRNQSYTGTMGGVTLVVRVNNNAPQGRYCNFADIRATNSLPWRTSEFANEISTVLKRNCVDIVSAALTISKTANVASITTGNTVTYTINYCNSAAAAGWINGGRSGVNFSFGLKTLPGATDNVLDFFLRANHEAAEPTVDWGNYRISYFLNSPYHGAQWGFSMFQKTGFDSATASITTEDFVACMPTACTDATGKYWNQRLMIQFGNRGAMTAEPTHQLYLQYMNTSRIHMGNATEPFFLEGALTASYNAQDWTDDWSQQQAWSAVSQSHPMFPINPDWTKGDGTSVPVTKINKHACETSTNQVNNILIEEWDGYTWRRVFGNGPMPGREVTGVVITDSLPACMNFGDFITTTPAGTWTAGTRTLQWNVGNMQINQCGVIQYYAIAGACPCAANNIASVKGDKEAAVSDNALVNIVCGSNSPTYTSTPGTSPTFTPTSTPTSTPSRTPTPTYTRTPTPSFTPSNTPSRTPTPSFTFTPSPSPTSTFTRTSTATPSRTATPSFTNSTSPTFTYTVTFTPSATPTRTPTPTYTRTPSPSLTSTFTATFTSTPSRTATPSFTNSTSPTFTYTVTFTPTSTPTRTPTLTYTRTPSPSPTSTFTATSTYTPSRTVTPTYTNTQSPTFSSTASPTRTISPTFTATPTRTITSLDTPTVTPTITRTFTATPTYTASPTFTSSVSSTFTFTVSSTPTSTPSRTATPTYTNTQSPTFSSTASPTRTISPTFTATPTRTITSLDTPTVTPSVTQTFTPSPTYTASPTSTFTRTQTSTSTNTPSVTITSINTPTVTPTITFTRTQTSTATVSPSYTGTPTYTPSRTMTWTPVIFSPTFTLTATDTRTMTASPTQSYTLTATPTSTSTRTYTLTSTFTSTRTITNSPTQSSTWSATPTSTPTFTRTGTPTITVSPTLTWTRTSTDTVTPTCTVTYTPAPPPADISVSLEATGDSPAVGANITYTIHLTNTTDQPVSNITIWDTLPAEMLFTALTSTGVTLTQTGNYIVLSDLLDQYGNPFVLAPGEDVSISFTVQITSLDPTRLPLTNIVGVDYNDLHYTETVGTHPAIYSDTSFYPTGRPVVFPNPFNPGSDGEITFANIVPGSIIQIFTISGESVQAIQTSQIKAHWNGKNRNGKEVSAGVYYFVITNTTSGEVKKGKIFVIKR